MIGAMFASGFRKCHDHDVEVRLIHDPLSEPEMSDNREFWL